MNTKPIPAIIILLAGLVTSIVVFKNDYEVVSGLKTLLVVLIIFYIIGLILKVILNRVFNSVPYKSDLENQTPEEQGASAREKVGVED